MKYFYFRSNETPHAVNLDSILCLKKLFPGDGCWIFIKEFGRGLPVDDLSFEEVCDALEKIKLESKIY